MSSSRSLAGVRCHVHVLTRTEGDADQRFLPVTSGSDEIEKDVDAVVAESWVTLDPRLLGKNVIVLSLEVANNLGEAVVAVQPKHHNGAMLPSFASG